MTDKKPLTDLLIRRAAPSKVPYRITDHNGERTGLFLQVLPSGKKEFRLRFTDDKKLRCRYLGSTRQASG